MSLNYTVNHNETNNFAKCMIQLLSGTGIGGLESTICHRYQNAVGPRTTTAAGARRTTTTTTTTLRKTGSIGNIRTVFATSAPSTKSNYKGYASSFNHYYRNVFNI